MPAALSEDKSNTNELMRKALKTHILRERERQKQEREAEVEEERLRKEREAREQQDVMTLGETREQIKSLETKLQQLKEEKHQLFLQLKKVLNEDDNRRRQLVKESNEMLGLQSMQQGGIVHQQIFIPQSVSRVATVPQAPFKTISKRPRSPSPQPTQATSVYHPSYAYKSGNVGNATYPNSPQKTSQYPNQPTSYYTVAAQEIPMYYSQGPLQPREPARAVYDTTRSQSYHMEPKQLEHYALRAPAPHGHVIHAGVIPINAGQGSQKAPNLAAAYPVRAQTQYQQVPTAAPPTLYTAQNRPLYQATSASLGYPPRE